MLTGTLNKEVAAMTNINDLILRFFRDDVKGILITDEKGEIIYEDEKTREIRDFPNWRSACPPADEEQKNEAWELLNAGGKSYLAVTTSVPDGNRLLQIHYFMENSEFVSLYRGITEYTRMLRDEQEHDAMTGLFNKSKFLAMKSSLFARVDTIAILNMDINNLKETNDALGHDAGDRLILLAASSLHRIEARNVMPFRLGGDEFLVAALHMSEKQAEDLRREWEAGLRELNAAEDVEVPCHIACGMSYGTRGDNLDELLELADRRMYEEKKAWTQRR